MCMCACVYVCVCMCVCHANVVQFCTVICHSAPRATSMAITRAMKNVWKVSAAAEHGQPAAAEHGTNIAFANMDWKSARHTGNKWKDHRATWQRTTKEIKGQPLFQEKNAKDKCSSSNSVAFRQN